MAFWKRKSSPDERRMLEKLHEAVALELKEDQVSAGLWTQATAECDGDEKKILSRYINLRVQALKDLAEQEIGLDGVERDDLDIDQLPKELRVMLGSREYAKLFLSRPRYQQKGYLQWVVSAPSDTQKQDRIKKVKSELKFRKRYFGQNTP